jgi:hypothetical protein
MKRRLMMALAALTLFADAFAHAATQNNVTIDQIGVIDNVAYFNIIGSFSVSCPYGLVYVDLTTIGGRSNYSLLLTAKLTGTPLSLIEYSLQTRAVESQELCYLIQSRIRD